jgi:hypothetical protein
VTFPDPALPCSFLPEATSGMLVLEPIDGYAARGLLLPATVFNRAEDRKFLSLTAHRMFSASGIPSTYRPLDGLEMLNTAVFFRIWK